MNTQVNYKIPYHKKECDYTCGAAALRMAVEGITNTDFSEKSLAIALGTQPDIGTPLRLFEQNVGDVAEVIYQKTGQQLEFYIAFEQNHSVLKELLQNNYLILLNYTKLNGNPHWAVLNRIDDQGLELSDPDFGPQTRYSFSEFNWIGGSKQKVKKALVAIRFKSN